MSSTKLKVLNGFAGMGGNRKLWQNVEVTAIEKNPKIAALYQNRFPNDKVVVDDLEAYLLKHFKKFDFIWLSPPCPTHSTIRFMASKNGDYEPLMPDLKLYSYIIFLKHFFKGKYVVENVRSYYDPLIKPQELQSHYFWSNFPIADTGLKRKKVRNDKGQSLIVKMEQQGFDIKDFHGYPKDKRTLLNNCVEPELGLHILRESLLQTSL